MKYRFPILCLAVTWILCLHTRNGQWLGDFWEHSAVVRELATHPLHPTHPQLLLDAPHAFYSPYTVMVALLARALHWDAVKALAIMGLVNWGLLVLGLRLFVFSLVSKHRSATVFYTLLLTLFWWGRDAWLFSGFFHIGVLGYVLPYPSTFAAALTLIALGVNGRRMESERQIGLLPVFLIAVTVLISHPITFLVLAAGLVSQSCTGKKGSRLSESVLAAGLLSLAFLLAIFWPYFPMVKLFVRESGVYDADNRIMYEQVVRRLWPALIGVPLVIAGMRANRLRPLVLMLVILSGIYACGAISGRYSYGRVVASMVLLLHIAIAEHLAALEARVNGINCSPWRRRLVVSASVMVLVLLLSWPPLRTTLAHALPKQPPLYESYLFLSRFTGQYDVVLSDIETSWIVPTFGGKVVAADHPLAFVPDQFARRADLDRFFNQKTVLADRQQILEKYKVNYLLLRKLQRLHWRGLQQSFMPQGHVVFESDTFVLMSLNQPQR